MHHLTNKHDLPNAVVAAIQRQRANPGRIAMAKAMAKALNVTDTIGHTTLMEPPRHTMYKTQDIETTEDAQDAYYALFGQMTHTVLEGVPEDEAMTEYAFGMRWSDSIGLTAQLDLVTVEAGLATAIDDYKTTSVWEYIYGMREERILQLNLQRYIATLASCFSHSSWDGHVDAHPPRFVAEPKLFITYFFRDWRQSEAQRKPDYPQHPVIRVPVPLWPMQNTALRITQMIKDRKAALHGFARDCSHEERWLRPGSFRVLSKTKDRKRWKQAADRVVPTEEEALRWIEWKGWIKPGDPLPDHIKIEYEGDSFRRCEPKTDQTGAYCPFAHVCPQVNR